MDTLVRPINISERCYTPDESIGLADLLFGRITEYDMSDDEVARSYSFAKAAVAFYEDVKETDEWKGFYDIWCNIQHLYGLAELKSELNAVPELTMKHLPIIIDPLRNTILNNASLTQKVAWFHQRNPSARRASNVLRGTFLYAADQSCRHKVRPGVSSGVQCANCSGWFCF